MACPAPPVFIVHEKGISKNFHAEVRASPLLRSLWLSGLRRSAFLPSSASCRSGSAATALPSSRRRPPASHGRSLRICAARPLQLPPPRNMPSRFHQSLIPDVGLQNHLHDLRADGLQAEQERLLTEPPARAGLAAPIISASRRPSPTRRPGRSRLLCRACARSASARGRLSSAGSPGRAAP